MWRLTRDRVPADSATGRNNWKVHKFAEANHLGSPVGVNFYLAEFDDYVPILFASLSR